MKRKHWWLFGGIQLAGTLVGMRAGHGDAISWGLSMLLLLPGSLVSQAFFAPGRIGTSWPEWTLFAITVATNLLIFAATSILLAGRRKSN